MIAGLGIARRNINNLRYADYTSLMAESKEELKGLLMKVKEESEKTDLKLNVQKTKIVASGPIISWQIDGKKNGNSDRLYFLGLQNHCLWQPTLVFLPGESQGQGSLVGCHLWGRTESDTTEVT